MLSLSAESILVPLEPLTRPQHPTGDLPGVIRPGPGHRHPALILVRPAEAASLSEALRVKAAAGCSGGSGEPIEERAERVGERSTFVVVDGTTDRQWAYVAMSRGRQANTLYLVDAEPAEEWCTHLTHADSHDALGRVTAALNRSSTHTAAIDCAGSTPPGDTDSIGPPPPSRDIAARVAWIVQRRTEREETQRQSLGPNLGVGR